MRTNTPTIRPSINEASTLLVADKRKQAAFLRASGALKHKATKLTKALGILRKERNRTA